MLDGLNSAQRKAVTTLSGPLLVLAGAGTGKTRVVTFRIANLIAHGTRPGRILAVTFTNKAAAEMQQRIHELLRRRTKDKPVVSTFHSHCVKILRRHIRQLGYPEKFAIYDRSDQESVARAVLREIRVSDQTLRPADALQFISQWKSRSFDPSQAAAAATSTKEHLAAVAYRRYQKALKTRGAVDFDDLLLCTVELFAKHPDALAEEAARFDHLLIDEYQDTNGSQYRIVKALAAAHRNLCVVGDDDQSIYGWRGAEVDHILGFSRDWPDATVVRLEQNYRSTAEILELAIRLIAFNTKRHPKVLRAARQGGTQPRIETCADETAEARTVVADIHKWLQKPGWEPNDFAILFRTNEQPRTFEAELRRTRLPYVLIGGMSFFDRREVREVLAYLKLLVSPRDEASLLRIINVPARGLGDASVQRLTAAAVAAGQTVWDVLVEHSVELPAAAQRATRELESLVSDFQRGFAAGTSLAETLRRLLERIDYLGEVRRRYPDVDEQQSRVAAVEEVVNALAEYQAQTPRATLEEFVQDIAVTGQEMDRDKDKQLRRNAIVLMTLHSAKGLEFPHVYLVGLEEGLLPHRRSLDLSGESIAEERRLCYVGVTRAREFLTLTHARTRRKWGRPRDSHPSRFLFELTGQADRPAARARASG